MKNIFPYLVYTAAFALAGSAAYYSVFGLSKLFSEQAIAVIIMASTLEISKLITASYLHRYWNKITILLKSYLVTAVFILMMITSIGIYGFLISAYQTTADKLTVTEKQTQVIELKRERFQEQLTEYVAEKTQLNQSINELTKGLSNNVIQYKDAETGQLITTTSSSTRKTLERQLTESKSQRDNVALQIEALTDSVTTLDLQILDLESNNEVASELGPLRYVAELTQQPMNRVVNWFIMIFIFVFDPLAITLLIAAQISLKKPEMTQRDVEKIIESNENPPEPTEKLKQAAEEYKKKITQPVAEEDKATSSDTEPDDLFKDWDQSESTTNSKTRLIS